MALTHLFRLDQLATHTVKVHDTLRGVGVARELGIELAQSVGLTLGELVPGRQNSDFVDKNLVRFSMIPLGVCGFHRQPEYQHTRQRAIVHSVPVRIAVHNEASCLLSSAYVWHYIYILYLFGFVYSISSVCELEPELRGVKHTRQVMPTLRQSRPYAGVRALSDVGHTLRSFECEFEKAGVVYCGISSFPPYSPLAR